MPHYSTLTDVVLMIIIDAMLHIVVREEKREEVENRRRLEQMERLCERKTEESLLSQ